MTARVTSMKCWMKEGRIMRLIEVINRLLSLFLRFRCAIDIYILQDLKYEETSSYARAYVEAHVFK